MENDPFLGTCTRTVLRPSMKPHPHSCHQAWATSSTSTRLIIQSQQTSIYTSNHALPKHHGTTHIHTHHSHTDTHTTPHPTARRRTLKMHALRTDRGTKRSCHEPVIRGHEAFNFSSRKTWRQDFAAPFPASLGNAHFACCSTNRRRRRRLADYDSNAIVC